MRTVCDNYLCVGCEACTNICKQNAITVKDNGISLSAVIDDNKCNNCGSCHKICQNNNEFHFNIPMYWKQGWAEDEIRTKSSSGGIARSLMKSFLFNKGEVYSCSFYNGDFLYRKVQNEDDIIHFIGSKYVKSCPGNVYDHIKNDLKNNKRVLFIGLPCHVQALRLFVERYQKNLYCVDMICHGTPSKELLQQYLAEENVDISTIEQISFRNKTNFYLSINNKKFAPKNVIDFWMHPFLEGLNYTENCYNCKFARFERIGDFTIGDAWGTELPSDERKKGISLLIMEEKDKAQKGEELLKSLGGHLEDVDIENIKNKNPQLVKPSEKPKERPVFIRNYQRGYKIAIEKSYSKLIFKQKLRQTPFAKLYKKCRGRLAVYFKYNLPNQ